MGATESKLAFRKSVFQLYEQQNIPATNEEYWANFYKLPETAEDVFNLFAPKDIRRVREVAVSNLETLFQKIIGRLFTFVSSTAAAPTKDDCRDVLNCIRILTRLLPYAFEMEDGRLEEKLFWSPAEGEEPLGSILAKAVVQLLFFRGFTLPTGTEPLTAHGVQYIIWQQGVGASVSPPTTRAEVSNRTETLRLLLTLLSHTIYVPTAKVTRTANKWADVIATRLEKKATLSLLCSTLNTAVNYDPVGWALLPYNHLLFADVQEQLVTICLQTLIALLDIRLTSAETSPPSATSLNSPTVAGDDSRRSSMASSSATASFGQARTAEGKNEDTRNDFGLYAGKLHRNQDFVLVMNGFCRILKNPLDSANTYLPGSTKRVNFHTEVLMLFWKLMDNNAKFAQHAMESDKILVILASILYFAIEARSDPAQVGFVRMCSFLLHMLSQDRNFAVQLNSTFDHAAVGAAAKAVPAFTSGTWADFYFLAVHTLCTTPVRPPSLPLHEPLLTALANVSPYIKTLTVTTSTKLLSLFSAFSNPAFMLANEHNHKNVFFILEVFNNLIQYQVTGNAPLIYGVVRYKQKFYALHDLTFEHAQSELTRVKTLRAQKSQTSADGTTPTGVASDRRESEAMLEADALPPPSAKAKGKLPATAEGANDTVQSQDVAPPSTPVDEKGKFAPSQEWFLYWHSHLPLHTILTLLDTLAPTIEQLCVEKGINDDRKVLEFLESGTLVGVLPVPHPIYVRKFVASVGIRVWFCGWFWGCVYMKSNGMGAGEAAKICPPIWTGTQIRLFTVKMSS